MSSYSQAATFYFKQDATTKSQLKHPDCTPTCDHGSQTQFIVEKERNLYHIDQSAMVRFSHRRDERGKNENVNCSITNAQERLCVNSRRGASRELMSKAMCFNDEKWFLLQALVPWKPRSQKWRGSFNGRSCVL
jgi:hypothetical protein